MPRKAAQRSSRRLEELTPDEILEVCGPSDAELRAKEARQAERIMNQSNDQMVQRYRKIGRRIRIHRATIAAGGW